VLTLAAFNGLAVDGGNILAVDKFNLAHQLLLINQYDVFYRSWCKWQYTTKVLKPSGQVLLFDFVLFPYFVKDQVYQGYLKTLSHAFPRNWFGVQGRRHADFLVFFICQIDNQTDFPVATWTTADGNSTATASSMRSGSSPDALETLWISLDTLQG
jgi:hypothetical protein